MKMTQIRVSWLSVLSMLCLGLADLVAAADQKSARPPWMGSTAGISDEVLPPWTPVEVSDDAAKVAVWGRRSVARKWSST